MKRLLILAVAFVALCGFAAEPDFKAWDANAPAKRHPVPCRIAFDEVGVGFSARSYGINLSVGPHWNHGGKEVLSCYYFPPKGKSTYLGGGIPSKDEPLAVEFLHYRDHSEVRVVSKKNGIAYLVLPEVDRKAPEAKAPNVLEFKLKDGRPIGVENLVVETVADKKVDRTPPPAPAGHELVFTDRFNERTSKWGRETDLSGVLTIPKKSYFCYSYPFVIPGLDLADGILAADLSLEGGTIFSFRFRATADDYYELVSRRGALSIEKKVCGQPAVVLTKKPARIKPGEKVHVELRLDGPNMIVSVDGQEVLSARDGAFSHGSVFVCGSSSYEVRLRGVDVFAKKGSGTTYREPKPASAAAVASAVDPKAVRPEEDLSKCKDGVFVDAKGRRHVWGVDKRFLWYDGLPYVPLAGSDDQYFLLYEPRALGDARAWNRLRDEKTLADLSRFGLTWQGVFLRLADYVDPTKTDHAFSDDGGNGGVSRLQEIAGDVFRVTDARRSLLSYFSYTTRVRNPHRPHVIAYLVPNDRERYLGVFGLPNESGSFGLATGRTFACDGKNTFGYACYWPRANETEWLFLHNTYMAEISKKLDWSSDSGAAVGGFWIMELIGEETDAVPLAHDPKTGPVREIGDYFQRSGFIFSQFGVKADVKAKGERAAAERRRAFGAWMDHLAFAGFNNAQVCWLGTDWMIHAGTGNNVGYPSKCFSKYSDGACDFRTELLPELDKRNFSTYLSTATFNFVQDCKNELGFTPEDWSVDETGKPHANFGNVRLDVASPKVREVYCRILDELAAEGATDPHVKGVAISLDGFFQLQGGYGTNALKRCERETPLRFPDYRAAAAYRYLTNDVTRLRTWTTWRGKMSHELIVALRDTIRRHNPDWTLLVRYLNNYTYQFAKKDEARQREICERTGILPELYRDEEGLLFCPRAFYEAKVKALPGAWSFRYDHGITDVPTRAGTAHHQWTAYWETPGIFPIFSKYTYGWLGCPNTIPVNRGMLETATAHLANENIRYLAYQAWESATAGTEHLMRRFATAFRALPVAEPHPFAGEVSGPDGLHVAWYGGRLAIVNPTARSGKVVLKGVDAKRLVELGRGRTYDRAFFGRTFEIDVLPYDLLVFALDAQST